MMGRASYGIGQLLDPIRGRATLSSKPGVSLADSLNPRLISCIPPGCLELETTILFIFQHF
jgi:hypothetical protein